MLPVPLRLVVGRLDAVLLRGSDGSVSGVLVGARAAAKTHGGADAGADASEGCG